MDSHLNVQIQRFVTREEAIAVLTRWYICYQCSAFTQPYRLNQTEDGFHYVMGCGCETSNLDLNVRVVRAIRGGHSVDMFITFETVEKDGHQSQHMTQWARSFLTNYYNMQWVGNSTAGSSNGGSTINCTDTGAVVRTMGITASNHFFTLATQDVSADNTYGMQVGTGTAANTGSTAALSTLIANGSAATQINYGSMGITQPSGTAPLSYTFTRTFTNNSGSTITINEVGLVYSSTDSGGTGRLIMWIRDVVTAVPVLNGANTTGTYTLSYTIS